MDSGIPGLSPEHRSFLALPKNHMTTKVNTGVNTGALCRSRLSLFYAVVFQGSDLLDARKVLGKCLSSKYMNDLFSGLISFAQFLKSRIPCKGSFFCKSTPQGLTSYECTEPQFPEHNLPAPVPVSYLNMTCSIFL